jgi:four helix bundle protein
VRHGGTEFRRRAAVSIPANIAESCGRRTRREEARFLQIAFSSACELEAEFLLARDLGFLPADDAAALEAGVVEVQRMLNTLTRRTWARAAEGR